MFRHPTIEVEMTRERDEGDESNEDVGLVWGFSHLDLAKLTKPTKLTKHAKL